jgi:hypothetical protein
MVGGNIAGSCLAEQPHNATLGKNLKYLGNLAITGHAGALVPVENCHVFSNVRTLARAFNLAGLGLFHVELHRGRTVYLSPKARRDVREIFS